MLNLVCEYKQECGVGIYMIKTEMFTRLSERKISFFDERGSITILYESNEVVLKKSNSKKGVFRGMHRQVAPALQEKLIRVISGRILDFVTDPDDEKQVIWCDEIDESDGWVHIGSQLAHGFFALDDVEFEYFCDGAYREDLEECYRVELVLKRDLGIDNIILSQKDLDGRSFGKCVKFYNRNNGETF